MPENNPLWFDVLLYRPTGVVMSAGLCPHIALWGPHTCHSSTGKGLYHSVFDWRPCGLLEWSLWPQWSQKCIQDHSSLVLKNSTCLQLNTAMVWSCRSYEFWQSSLAASHFYPLQFKLAMFLLGLLILLWFTLKWLLGHAVGVLCNVDGLKIF